MSNGSSGCSWSCLAQQIPTVSFSHLFWIPHTFSQHLRCSRLPWWDAPALSQGSAQGLVLCVRWAPGILM